MNPITGEPSKHDVEITIDLSNIINEDIVVDYVAAAPADTMSNFSGSGLPYGTIEQAYYNTPNKGSVQTVNKIAFLRLRKPNSYYIDFNVLRHPHVTLSYNNKMLVDVLLDMEKINHRSLQYNDPGYFRDTLRKPPSVGNVVKTQEQLIRSKAYKSHVYS